MLSKPHSSFPSRRYLSGKLSAGARLSSDSSFDRFLHSLATARLVFPFASLPFTF